MRRQRQIVEPLDSRDKELITDIIEQSRKHPFVFVCGSSFSNKTRLLERVYHRHTMDQLIPGHKSYARRNLDFRFDPYLDQKKQSTVLLIDHAKNLGPTPPEFVVQDGAYSMTIHDILYRLVRQSECPNEHELTEYFKNLNRLDAEYRAYLPDWFAANRQGKSKARAFTKQHKPPFNSPRDQYLSIRMILVKNCFSSLHYLQFQLLDMIGKWAYGNSAPFGGIPVIVEGDPKSLQCSSISQYSHMRSLPIHCSEVWKQLMRQESIVTIPMARRAIKMSSEVGWFRDVVHKLRTVRNDVDQEVLAHLTMASNETPANVKMKAAAVFEVVETPKAASTLNERLWAEEAESFSKFKPPSKKKAGSGPFAFLQDGASAEEEEENELMWRYKVKAYIPGSNAGGAGSEVTWAEIAKLVVDSKRRVPTTVLELRIGVPVTRTHFRNEVGIGVVVGFTDDAESLPRVIWADGNHVPEVVRRIDVDVWSATRKKQVNLTFIPLQHAYALTLEQLVNVRLPPHDEHWWMLKPNMMLMSRNRNILYFIASRVGGRKYLILEQDLLVIPDWDGYVMELAEDVDGEAKVEESLTDEAEGDEAVAAEEAAVDEEQADVPRIEEAEEEENAAEAAAEGNVAAGEDGVPPAGEDGVPPVGEDGVPPAGEDGVPPVALLDPPAQEEESELTHAPLAPDEDGEGDETIERMLDDDPESTAHVEQEERKRATPEATSSTAPTRRRLRKQVADDMHDEEEEEAKIEEEEPPAAAAQESAIIISPSVSEVKKPPPASEIKESPRPFITVEGNATPQLDKAALLEVIKLMFMEPERATLTLRTVQERLAAQTLLPLDVVRSFKKDIKWAIVDALEATAAPVADEAEDDSIQ